MTSSAPGGVILLEREGAGLSAQSRERAASEGYAHTRARLLLGAAHAHAMRGARPGQRACADATSLWCRVVRMSCNLLALPSVASPCHQQPMNACAGRGETHLRTASTARSLSSARRGGRFVSHTIECARATVCEGARGGGAPAAESLIEGAAIGGSVAGAGGGA